MKKNEEEKVEQEPSAENQENEEKVNLKLSAVQKIG